MDKVKGYLNNKEFGEQRQKLTHSVFAVDDKRRNEAVKAIKL